jgi:hypothetical protein
VLAHLFRATPQRSRRAGNSIENQSDHSDGRQLENHTHRDHQRYETRSISATNSIRQLCGSPAVSVGRSQPAGGVIDAAGDDGRLHAGPDECSNHTDRDGPTTWARASNRIECAATLGADDRLGQPAKTCAKTALFRAPAERVDSSRRTAPNLRRTRRRLADHVFRDPRMQQEDQLCAPSSSSRRGFRDRSRRGYVRCFFVSATSAAEA